MAESGGEKSFEATPQRVEQFHKQGKFARSKDAAAVVATAAVLATLVGGRVAIGHALHYLFLRTHGDLGALARSDGDGAFQAAIGVFSALAVPAILASAIAGAVISMVQTGGRINTENLGLDLTRLNPLPRLQQLFSPMAGGKEALLSLMRVGIVGYVAYLALKREVPGLLIFARTDLEGGCVALVDASVHVVVNALGALAAVSAVDYAQSRFTLNQEMKMTRQEVMDEHKQSDGDPKMKHRMRARARNNAKRRAMENVKTATVVVANPTHISVALRYSKTDPAPIVVAKGHDDFAMQIRAEARRHGIPILENRPLARALDSEVPVGRPVPAAHFAAVARVLAFVYKIKGRKG